MSQENVEIVRRGYERYASGDAEWVSTLFAETAELPDAGGLGVADTATGTLTGPAGFLRSANESLEGFDDFHVDVEDVVEAGDAVIALVRIAGKGKASGALLEIRLTHLWVFGDDGKIIRGEVHRNKADALNAAVRLPEVGDVAGERGAGSASVRALGCDWRAALGHSSS